MERYGLREDRALHALAISCLRFFVVTCIAKTRVCLHCTVVKLGDQPKQEKTSDDTGAMEAPDHHSRFSLTCDICGLLFLFQARA